MTRTVTSNVMFECNYAGCPKTDITAGPLPDNWGELNLVEFTKPEVDPDTKLITKEAERSPQTYHLCPDHVPKLGPD